MNAPFRNHTGRVGRYMHTAYGPKYFPLDPRPDEVHAETIAHHLATRCRYNGACWHANDLTKIFYSVAEHSVYCSEYVPTPEELEELGITRPMWDATALERLLHDGSEAYNGDLIRPLKYDVLFSAPFKVVEELNETVIGQRFGLEYPFPAAVKIADEAVTAAEVNQIIRKDPSEDWITGQLHDPKRTAPIQIEMWLPFDAKIRFLKRFNELWDFDANHRR